MLLRQINPLSSKSLIHVFSGHHQTRTSVIMSSSEGRNPGVLKLLCLHGYLQDASIFRSKIGSMRKALKSRLEFVFLDAPFAASPDAATLSSLGLKPSQSIEDKSDAEETTVQLQGRSWWQWTDNGDNSRPSRAYTYTGWDEVTREYLLSAIREHRPDGLLGFSQGAAAIGLLLSSLPPDLEERPSFAIIISGFLPRDEKYRNLVVEARPSDRTPCLVVYGAKDELVEKERSIELINALGGAGDDHPADGVKQGHGWIQVFEHSGAHLVPTCSGEFKAKVVGFLDRIQAPSR